MLGIAAKDATASSVRAAYLAKRMRCELDGDGAEGRRLDTANTVVKEWMRRRDAGSREKGPAKDDGAARTSARQARPPTAGEVAERSAQRRQRFADAEVRPAERNGGQDMTRRTAWSGNVTRNTAAATAAYAARSSGAGGLDAATAKLLEEQQRAAHEADGHSCAIGAARRGAWCGAARRSPRRPSWIRRGPSC